MDAEFAQLHEEGPAETGLQQRFAARNGHAAAAPPLKVAVLQREFQRLFHRDSPAAELERTVEAGRLATAAANAAFPLEAVSARPDAVRSGRTGRHAVSAVRAEFFPVQQLRPGGNALRIVAPAAAQRAPFQEKGGAQSRPVMDGQRLDVGQQRLDVQHDLLSAS